MKTRTLVIGIVLACATLLVALIAAGVGFFFFTYRNMDAAFSPRIDALFAAMENDTFGNTYLTETAPELRKVMSREKYEQLGLTVKLRLGSLQSKKLTHFNLRQFNANSYGEVLYSASFEKGSGTIRASFKRIGGQWRLLGIYVASPKFEKELAAKKCPHCGEPCPASAKFCPSCGEAVADREAQQ